MQLLVLWSSPETGHNPWRRNDERRIKTQIYFMSLKGCFILQHFSTRSFWTRPPSGKSFTKNLVMNSCAPLLLNKEVLCIVLSYILYIIRHALKQYLYFMGNTLNSFLVDKGKLMALLRFSIEHVKSAGFSLTIIRFKGAAPRPFWAPPSECQIDAESIKTN